MSTDQPLESVFETALDETDGEKVSVGELMDRFGHRSFGPFFLVMGLITVVPPIGGIPGLPAIVGLIILLFSTQMLLGMDHVWLPSKIEEMSLSKDRIETAHDKLSGFLAEIDRFVTHRLEWAAGGAARYVAAVIVSLLALALIPLELVPFAVAIPGWAISMIGLALMARDGAFMLLAFAIAAVAGWVLVAYGPFGG